LNFSIYKIISAPPREKRQKTIEEDIQGLLKLVDVQDLKVDV
jgi:hypothetical protein